MKSNVIWAAMALRGIRVSEIAKAAGVSKSCVYKTIQGIRNSDSVMKVVTELLGDDISAIQGGLDELGSQRNVV